MLKRILSMTILVATLAWADGIPVTAPDGSFTATFPTQPQALGSTFTAMKDGAIFQIISSPSFSDAASQLAAFRRQEERTPGAKIKMIRSGKFEGLEISKTNRSGRSSLSRVFVVENKIYNIEATLPAGQPNTQAVAFVESFQLSSRLNATGNLKQQMEEGTTRYDRAHVVACTSNLKNIATGCEMFASDNGGKYPTSLQQLVGPTYLGRVPTCLSARAATYVYRGGGQRFEVYCSGHHHKVARLPPDYPRIDQSMQVWEGPNKPFRR